MTFFLIFNNSSSMMFFSSLTFSISLAMSSNSMIMIWIMIEMSNMSFIPLMMSKKMKNSESIMKFFIIQSLSSMILIFSMMMNLLETKFTMMKLLSLIMKMGGAPFQAWMISMIEGIKFDTMFIMFTVLKLAPMNLISIINLNLNKIIIISFIIPTIMIINQTMTKKMLAYSSIINLSMMLILSSNMKMWIYFVINYFLVMYLIMMELKNNKIKFINQMMFN